MPAAPRSSHARANLLALATIALWASLATLGASLAHVPPFLLTGLGLLAGSAIALPASRPSPVSRNGGTCASDAPSVASEAHRAMVASASRLARAWLERGAAGMVVKWRILRAGCRTGPQRSAGGQGPGPSHGRADPRQRGHAGPVSIRNACRAAALPGRPDAPPR